MSGEKPTGRKSAGLPDELIWALATLSLVLPFVAFGLGAVGCWRLLSGEPGGWPLIGIAVAVAGVELLIDLWLANPKTSASDDPDLNRRGAQFLGRMAEVIEPIEAGRGKVRLGDTVWMVECADELPAGAMVRVVGSDGAVLRVESLS